MATKKALNLSIHQKVLQEAEAIMSLRGIGSLSVLVEELLRCEYEKRFGTVVAKATTSELADQIENVALAEIAQQQPLEAPPLGAPTRQPIPTAPPAKSRSTKAGGRSSKRSA